jgi:hypothetical protein
MPCHSRLRTCDLEACPTPTPAGHTLIAHPMLIGRRFALVITLPGSAVSELASGHVGFVARKIAQSTQKQLASVGTTR